ncbi:metal-sensitive transcriptional regulator [Leucobacter sp. gxy201]|uniref:metal-sensitive transcriptional regulator n=1 Tax=Leucobacter sp. gxy201 TaxID=2957200 RepID=UPI003DA0BF36
MDDATPAGEHLDAAGTPEAHAHEHGYIEHKDQLLKRLRRAEGQVRGVHRMIEEDAYCIDIITQVSAATKALERAALELLDDHLRHCVAEAAGEGGEVAAAKLKEASDAIARLVR